MIIKIDSTNICHDLGFAISNSTKGFVNIVSNVKQFAILDTTIKAFLNQQHWETIQNIQVISIHQMAD